MELGIFYTCYTETRAVEYSLKNLFDFYPDIKVYLVSDGGSDYRFLNEKFPDKNIKVNLEEDTRGIISIIDNKTKDFFKKESKEKMLKSIVVFLDRIKRAIDYCQSDYLLIMEPDVLVRGKLNIPENSIYLGNNTNKYFSKDLKKWMKNKGYMVPKHYGMVPLFSTKHFKEILKIVDDKLIEEIYHQDPLFPYYDKMLTILFCLIHVEEKFNSDVTECFRDKNWKTNKKPLVHQFRQYYPSKEEHKSEYSTENSNHLTDMFKNNKV